MTTRTVSPAPRERTEVQVRIGARLRAARQARGLTIAQVAEAAGLTKGFVSRLERDDVSPSVASLVTVCEVLGLRVGELFDPPETAVIRAGRRHRRARGPDHPRDAAGPRDHPRPDRARRQRR